MKNDHVHFNERLILKAFKVARRNWSNWCCVFGHRGPIRTNPILTDPVLFAKFCREYSVGRTIRAGKRELFRRELLKSTAFLKAIKEDTGRLMSRYEKQLRNTYGTGGANTVTSVLSKLAAFLWPDRFIAWDRFARRGLNLVQNRGINSQFEDYEDYLAKLDQAWKGDQGKLIKQIAKKLDGEQYPLKDELRFQRRVLDVCLMGVGGRKMKWS